MCIVPLSPAGMDFGLGAVNPYLQGPWSWQAVYRKNTYIHIYICIYISYIYICT